MTDNGGALGFVGYGTVGSTIGARARAVGLAVRFHDPRVDGSVELPALVEWADVLFICLPTPVGSDGRLDVSLVEDAVAAIPSTDIVVVSTVNPGTIASIAARHPRSRIAHVPEFLRSAHAAEDFESASRVVIGCADPVLADLLARLYTRFAPSARIVKTDPLTAEIAKLASNAFLAMKVVFANEVAAGCRNAGVSWEAVATILSLDPRIGDSHLSVMPEGGFDGHCLPKDTMALETWLRPAVGPDGLVLRILERNQALRKGRDPDGAG